MTKLHIKMPLRPLISIIISTKNEEANLPRLLDSIRGQTYSHYEIIIVDNFSSDSTVSIAKQYTDNVFIKGPERSAQRNFAAHKARGEYLLILDADMELSSDALSTYTHECLSGNYSALSIPERNPSPNFWAKCRDLEKRIARNEKHLVASRFITTRDFLSINGYDGNLVSAEDYDLDDRLRKAGFRIGTSNTVLKHYEDEGMKKIAQKKYYYGKMLPKYIAKHKQIALKRFNPLRQVYLKRVRLLLVNPVLGGGLIFLKLVDYLAGGLGLIIGLIRPI